MENKNFYKVVDLFGNETLKFSERKIENTKNLFTDYEGFIEKFETKKTTDDCYTPPEVFKIVLDYVGKFVDLSKHEIIRPFFPDADYQQVDYPENAIVIDNPPFSIISQICRYYIANDIKYFLFAPHLTLFGSDQDQTHVVASADIVYENGACVKTSFLTNILDDIKVISAPEIHDAVEAFNKKNRVDLPKYKYPDNVLTVSMVAQMAENGVHFQVKKTECTFVRGLDSQKPHKKAIFGSGLLISNEAAVEKNKLEKQVEKNKLEKQQSIEWELSQREKEIINNLSESKTT